jgi:hypothetical protein
MADYQPLFKPGDAITQTASAAITGGRLVAVSATGTVATSGADSAVVVGVAASDVAASGDKFLVYPIRGGGVHQLVASAAITAGDGVTSTNTGKVKTATTSLATAAAAGILLGIALNTVAADGDIVDVLTGG